MSRTTLSVLALAGEALRVGRDAFDPYAHPNSPRKFTQPQLFACLAVRQMIGVGYDAASVRLAEWSDLRDALGLGRVPSGSTPRAAERRPLKKSPAAACWMRRSAGRGAAG